MQPTIHVLHTDVVDVVVCGPIIQPFLCGDMNKTCCWQTIYYQWLMEYAFYQYYILDKCFKHNFIRYLGIPLYLLLSSILLAIKHLMNHLEKILISNYWLSIFTHLCSCYVEGPLSGIMSFRTGSHKQLKLCIGELYNAISY